MSKKLIAGVLSLAMIMSFASCGKTDDSSKGSSSSELLVETEKDTATTTATTEEETTEASTKEKTNLSDGITAEQAQEIAEKGIKALKEQDIEGIIKYTTLADLLRMEKPDTTDEEMISAVKDAINDQNGGLDFGGDFDSYEITLSDPVPMTEDEKKEFNDFLTKLSSEGTDSATGKPMPEFPEITDGYKFKAVASGKDGSNEESEMFVLCTNGEYRLDIAYTFIKEMYGAFSDMAEDFETSTSTETTEAETASEADATAPEAPKEITTEDSGSSDGNSKIIRSDREDSTTASPQNAE